MLPSSLQSLEEHILLMCERLMSLWSSLGKLLFLKLAESRWQISLHSRRQLLLLLENAWRKRLLLLLLEFEIAGRNLSSHLDIY
ncbi:hypothetical protein ACOSP7_017945 [Xanthoceras sorbifolium]